MVLSPPMSDSIETLRQLEHVQRYLYNQLQPLETKWWDYKDGLTTWTDDDQWLYLHYHNPLAEWAWFTRNMNR